MAKKKPKPLPLPHDDRVPLTAGQTIYLRCLGACASEYAVTLEPGKPSGFCNPAKVTFCPFCGSEFYEER